MSLPAAQAAHRVGLFPVDFTRMVGGLVTPCERSARVIGTLNNIVMAVGTAWAYRAALRRVDCRPTLLSGALLGVAHGAVSIGALLGISRIHPRHELAQLPSPRALRRNPFFFAVSLGGHALYGAIVAALLR